MRISCIQMDMAFARPEENFAKAKQLVRDAMANRPDVLVLPETWNTGFFPKEHLAELADRDCARVRRELGALAAELHVNLAAGSVANVRGGKVYNTACVFDREGNCVAEYDKTHLFTPMGEHVYFTPGDHLCRFRLDGQDCALLICYDIRFPEQYRLMASSGADAFLIAADFTKATGERHWEALLRTRAIENGCYVLAANQCGQKARFEAYGHSMIIAPDGEILAEADDTPQVLIAELDPEVLERTRNEIPSLENRRDDLYRVSSGNVRIYEE